MGIIKDEFTNLKITAKKRWELRHPEKAKESKRRCAYNYYKTHRGTMVKKKTDYRNDRKTVVTKLLGGKCTKCGYDRCISALDVHHLDFKEKEYREDYLRKDYDLSKIVLLCANCHREEHSLNKEAYARRH